MAIEFERKYQQLRVYASYDEVTEKVSKIQNQILEYRQLQDVLQSSFNDF